MSYDHSENILVQEAAGNLLHDELGWDMVCAYNKEVLGETGTLGRTDNKGILLKRDLRAALQKFNLLDHTHAGRRGYRYAGAAALHRIAHAD